MTKMKKATKRFKMVALGLLMVFAVSACGGQQQAPTEQNSEQTAQGEQMILIDVVGREVVLEGPAQKVVGTHNPTMNAVVVLGGGDKYLAGFGNKEMSRPLYEAVIPDFEGLPQIGKGSNINYEEVVATGADMAVLPERFVDLVDPFEEAGLNALVALPNEESFDTVKAGFTLLGQAFGAEERAEEINTFLDEKIKNAESITANVTDKKKVLFLGGSSPLSVAPDAMIQTQLIEIAGGENAVSGVNGTGDFIDVSIEQIIAWNPEVIWFPAYTDYTAEDLKNDPAWSSIAAVQNDAIYQFPSKVEPWDQPTAAVALGISWAINNLHPDLYTKEQVLEDADNFYGFIYGKTFTADELGLN